MAKEHIDPICKMEVKESEDAITAEYEGERYWFCSEGCKEEFLEEPEKYI